MRYIISLIVVAAFLLSPLVLFETMVTPQLEQLKHTYNSAETIANRAAGLR